MRFFHPSIHPSLCMLYLDRMFKRFHLLVVHHSLQVCTLYHDHLDETGTQRREKYDREASVLSVQSTSHQFLCTQTGVTVRR